MVTLHLSAADLSRTVLRSEPSVLLELGAAGQRVFQSTVPEHLVAWRARTRAALRPVMLPYLDLCRHKRWFPDFLTPPSFGGELGPALVEVAATPAAALTEQLRPRIEAGELPPRVGPLADGKPDAVRRLLGAMEAFHAVAVGAYWETIVAAVHADRAVRGRAIVDAGLDRVLRGLSPYLQFTPTGDTYELSYRCAFGGDVGLSPGGRGVTLVPSYFVPQPAVLDDPTGPLVLTYPIRPAQRELATGQSLAHLLGRSRAAVLGVVADGLSTSEVARAVGISLASASEHTSTLRRAGLVATHRAGSSVVHTLTPLGEHMLRAGRPDRRGGPITRR
ncbi:ArsR/SmtB family transcription factor [Micromonospora parva]|uniref:ArsR/SmtB family transcription factor n=1 Tax=Micromonospora parva TaxID=1464048 RepID=UPI00364EA3DE